MSKKYDKLFDREFLFDNYIARKKSCQEIAEIVGCSKTAVNSALIRNNINIRKSSQAQKVKFKISHKYNFLNDKNFLEKMYCDEKKSTLMIANLIGAKAASSVRQALIRHNIPLRNFSDGQTVSSGLNDYFILNENVIFGSLLGDAGLKRCNRNSESSYPCFYKRNIHFSHIEYIAKSIFLKDHKNRIKKVIDKKGNIFYDVKTLVHRELKEIDEKWYPKDNNFIKVIPRDLILNSEIILHWFLDDGYSCWVKGDYGKVHMRICTQSFSKDDQDFLYQQIKEKFNVTITSIKCRGGTGYLASDFLDLIGPCPVPELSYKWKFQTMKGKKNV